MTNVSPSLHLLWVYSASLTEALDAATWLRTTFELRRLGWQVTLLSVGPEGIQQIHGVEVFCLPRPEIYFLRQAVFHFRVLRFLFAHWETVDILLFHEVSAAWLLPLRFVRFLTRKRHPCLVLDTRSLPMEPPGKESWKDHLRRWVYLFVGRLGNYFADGRLAITQRMAVSLQIPVNKLWGTWPSGAEIEHFAKTQSVRHWPLPGEPIRLIYHGSLHYERNLMALSRAVVSANRAGMAFTLTLVGDGTEKTALQAFSTQSNGAIQVLPPVAYEKIPEFLADSQVGVLPFPDEEKYRVCSPIKLFEYLAAGLPILATRVVCHTDVLNSAGCVFWAETSTDAGLLEALRQVWQAHPHLSEMGQQSALAAKHWTWSASAEKLSVALEKGCHAHASVLEVSQG